MAKHCRERRMRCRRSPRRAMHPPPVGTPRRGAALEAGHEARQEDAMTTAKKADKRAEETGSGKGGTSNAAGTATGPGSSAASRDSHDAQRDIGGAGSAKTGNKRPGHKANS
jgi:hypothetical protein